MQGSTIIGLEHHTPDNIVDEIESAVGYQTDFHQFMLYTPVPGTPLYQEMADQGRLLTDVDSCRYSWAIQIQLPARRDFPRRFKALPGLGVLARF